MHTCKDQLEDQIEDCISRAVHIPSSAPVLTVRSFSLWYQRWACSLVLAISLSCGCF